MERELARHEKAQSAELAELVQVVKDGSDVFMRVGAALMRIRDAKLYQMTEHATFDAFCHAEFGFGQSYASRQIRAYETVTNIVPIGKKTAAKATKTPVLPSSEAVAREVAKAPPEQQAAAWDKAVEMAPKDEHGTPKVTAAHARKAVAAVVAPEPPAPKQDEAPPAPSGPPLYAAEVAEIDAACDEIDKVLVKLTRLLKANAAEKRCAVPFAHFVSYLGTLGEIRAGNKSLRDAMPGGASEKPPGYIPRSSVKIRNRGEAA